MKQVVQNEKLQTKILEAIDLLCDPVKTTLGPKGCNVIIDHSAFSPFITNDGVTIASQIASEDATVNTILELAKEAAIKTNEKVGDGTTTTLVLLQSIIHQGFNFVNSGLHPMILKKELTESLPEVVNLLKTKAWLPSRKQLAYIASISANSNTIGANIMKAFKQAKTIAAITLKESENLQDEIVFYQGYMLETLIASPYFWLQDQEKHYNNANVLLINDTLTDFNALGDILNYLVDTEGSLIVIANDYADEVINTWLSLVQTEQLPIVFLKIPGYAQEKYAYFEDLALISGAKITNDGTFLSIDNLGHVNGLTLDHEKATFSFKPNMTIKKTITKLKKQNDALSARRRAMLDTGLVDILVGAPTATERRERKMRYEDALNAIEAALHGVILGSGVTLLAIKELLPAKNYGQKIIQNALASPLKQILTNAGIDEDQILPVLKDSNYTKIYNLKTDSWEEKKTSQVLDPVVVVINALTNAVSIASMLLTTTSLIINENKPEIQPSSYTEL